MRMLMFILGLIVCSAEHEGSYWLFLINLGGVVMMAYGGELIFPPRPRRPKLRVLR